MYIYMYMYYAHTFIGVCIYVCIHMYRKNGENDPNAYAYAIHMVCTYETWNRFCSYIRIYDTLYSNKMALNIGLPCAFQE